MKKKIKKKLEINFKNFNLYKNPFHFLVFCFFLIFFVFLISFLLLCLFDFLFFGGNKIMIITSVIVFLIVLFIVSIVLFFFYVYLIVVEKGKYDNKIFKINKIIVKEYDESDKNFKGKLSIINYDDNGRLSLNEKDTGKLSDM